MPGPIPGKPAEALTDAHNPGFETESASRPHGWLTKAWCHTHLSCGRKCAAGHGAAGCIGALQHVINRCPGLPIWPSGPKPGAPNPQKHWLRLRFSESFWTNMCNPAAAAQRALKHNGTREDTKKHAHIGLSALPFMSCWRSQNTSANGWWERQRRDRNRYSPSFQFHHGTNGSPGWPPQGCDIVLGISVWSLATHLRK